MSEEKLYVCSNCKKTFSSLEEKEQHQGKCLKQAVTIFCWSCVDYLPIEDRVILVLGWYFCTRACAEKFLKTWEDNFYIKIGRFPKAVGF